MQAPLQTDPVYVTYRLILSYDGTRYRGWQVQPNATSIQTLVEDALQVVLRQPTHIVGASRTDSGVHALAQVAHLTCDRLIDQKRLIASLNGLLPKDIRIHRCEQVADNFHARYWAKGKIYRYRIDRSLAPSPFTRLYTYHLWRPINVARLKQAATYFVGERDFTSFSNESHRGSASCNPIRTITRLDIWEEGDELILELEGDGFLYKMVRNIVGTLLDVERGTIPIRALPEIFAAKDRSRAGTTAPARGLCLIAVLYPTCGTKGS